MALAGGHAQDGCTQGWNGQSPASQTPCHFQITPGTKTSAQLSDEFLDMMHRIQGSNACTLEIGAPSDGQTIDPGLVNVEMVDSQGNVTTVPQSPTDGWTYDDPSHPTRVILHGPACSNAQKLMGGEVKVSLGCATQVK